MQGLCRGKGIAKPLEMRNTSPTRLRLEPIHKGEPLVDFPVRNGRSGPAHDFAKAEVDPLQRRRLGAGFGPTPWAKLGRMFEGFFPSCTAAKACAVRSHDQGAWVWRRRS
jgi:hypothetical protein